MIVWLFIASIYVFSGASAAQHSKKISFETFKKIAYREYALVPIFVDNKLTYAEKLADDIIAYVQPKKGNVFHDDQIHEKKLELALKQAPHNPFLLHAGLVFFNDMRKDECRKQLLMYHDPEALYWYADKELAINDSDHKKRGLKLLVNNARPRIVSLPNIQNNINSTLVYQHAPSLALAHTIYHRDIYLPLSDERVSVENKKEALRYFLREPDLINTQKEAVVLFSQIVCKLIEKNDISGLNELKSSQEFKKLQEIAGDDDLFQLVSAHLDNRTLDVADIFLTSTQEVEKKHGITLYGTCIQAEKDASRQLVVVDRLLKLTATDPQARSQLLIIEKKVREEWHLMPAALYTYASFLIEHDELGKAPGSAKASALELMRSIANIYAPAAWFLAHDCLTRKKVTSELTKKAIDYYKEARRLELESSNYLVPESLYTMKEYVERKVNHPNEKSNQVVLLNQQETSDQQASSKSMIEEVSFSPVKEISKVLCANLQSDVDEVKVTKSIHLFNQMIQMPYQDGDLLTIEEVLELLFEQVETYPIIYPSLIKYLVIQADQLHMVRLADQESSYVLETRIKAASNLHDLMRRAQSKDINPTDHLPAINKLTEQVVQDCFANKKIVDGIKLLESQIVINKDHEDVESMVDRLVLYWVRFGNLNGDFLEKALKVLYKSARKNNIFALKQIALSAFHGVRSEETLPVDIILSLIAHDPVFALQCIERLAEETELDKNEYLNWDMIDKKIQALFCSSQVYKDSDVIKWLYSCVKLHANDIMKDSYSLPHGYEYLLPYQAASFLTHDQPTHKEYEAAAHYIDSFISYLNQKQSPHDEYYELGMRKALSVLEKIKLEDKPLEYGIMKKLNILHHLLREYDAEGSAAYIKQRLCALFESKPLPIRYDAYHLHGGYFDVNFYLARAGHLLFKRDAILASSDKNNLHGSSKASGTYLKNKNNEHSNKKSTNEMVICFQETIKLITELANLLSESQGVKIIDILGNVAADFAAMPIMIPEKIRILEKILSEHPEQVHIAHVVLKLYMQSQQLEKAHNFYKWFAKNDPSGYAAYLVGMSLLTGQSIDLNDVILNFSSINKKEGIEFIESAFKKKLPHAFLEIAKWHLHGKYGYAKDFKRAAELFQEVDVKSPLQEHDSYCAGLAHYHTQEYGQAGRFFSAVSQKQIMPWLLSRVFLFSMAFEKQGSTPLQYGLDHLRRCYEYLSLSHKQLSIEDKKRIIATLEELKIDKKIEKMVIEVEKKQIGGAFEQLVKEIKDQGTNVNILSSRDLWLWVGGLHSYIKCAFKLGLEKDYKKAHEYLSRLKKVEHQAICAQVHLILTLMQAEKLLTVDKNNMVAELDSLYSLIEDIAQNCNPALIANEDMRTFSAMYVSGIRWLMKRQQISCEVGNEKCEAIKKILLKMGVIKNLSADLMAEFGLQLASITDTYFNHLDHLTKK